MVAYTRGRPCDRLGRPLGMVSDRCYSTTGAQVGQKTKMERRKVLVLIITKVSIHRKGRRGKGTNKEKTKTSLSFVESTTRKEEKNHMSGGIAARQR